PPHNRALQLCQRHDLQWHPAGEGPRRLAFASPFPLPKPARNVRAGRGEPARAVLVPRGPLPMKKAFSGKILLIGCGYVGRCTLPLLLRHLKMPPNRITVLDFVDARSAI